MSNTARYNFVLPDEFLQNQICTGCKKYLSCGPVKTYVRDGVYEIKCGRCTQDNDGGFVSMFNKVFEDAFFPCVNRLEGCNALVSYKDAKSHEETCKGTELSCFLCPPDNKKYHLMALINHFKLAHFKRFLSKPSFSIAKDVEADYLYHDTTRHILALITVRFEAAALLISVLSPLKTVMQSNVAIYNDSNVQSDSTMMYKSDFKNCRGFGDSAVGFRIPIVLLESCLQMQCVIEFRSFGCQVQHIIVGLNMDSEGVADKDKLAEIPTAIETRASGKTKFTSIMPQTPSTTRNPYSDQAFYLMTCLYCQRHQSITRQEKINVCASCNSFLCVSCNSYNGLNICPRCFTLTIQRYKAPPVFLNDTELELYCIFNCGRRFQAWQLLAHEAECNQSYYKY